MWSAKRLSLGDNVAIKVMKLNGSQQKARLRKEAEITSILNHPNICKVFDFIEQDEVCFLVMELLEGVDLQALLRNKTALKKIDRTCLALYLSKEVLRALDKAHQSNVLHQDIKPANIFLTKYGEVKLLDLGVAKFDNDRDLTKTSNSFFSLHYSSPEFWHNGLYKARNYSAKNDLYSLGLVFFEIIAGKKAYSGLGKDLFENLESGQLPTISDFCESPEICNIFSTWTDKNPNERLENAKVLLNLISDIALDYQINESIVHEAVKNLEAHNVQEDLTEKVPTLKIEDSMKLKHTGYLQDSTGREAEEQVLAVIEEAFGKDYARIFVNKTIPQKNKTPDFVIPVFDSKGVFKFLIVEVKASPIVYKDGTTNFSDPYTQITSYRNRLAHSLKKMNRQCEYLCHVVFPNAEKISMNLQEGMDGVIWMNLNSFKECLKGYKAVKATDMQYELVQMVYNNREVIQKYREKKYFCKEQEQILHWKFGGTRRITGLAGTGKSLVLAKKLVKDALTSKENNFLYLTHNINLVNKFQEYVTEFLEEEDVNILEKKPIRSAMEFVCEFNGRKFYITFCNFDAFSTSCITETFDKILYHASFKGPLYLKSCELRGPSPQAQNFRNEREALISMLEPLKKGREDIFEKYSTVYIDEFQDCRVDPSRAQFSLLFVKRNAPDEPNICFTEDSLQSFVKYKILQEIDDTFEDLKKNQLAPNQVLGLPSLKNRSRHLDTIYRTPERIFKLTLNILENQGGLLKNRKDKIMSLKYKNQHGEYFIIEENEVPKLVATMLNERLRFPHEILFIEGLDHRHKSDLFDKLNAKVPCNDVVNKQLPDQQSINFFHEFNVRGLEEKVVFLIVDEGLTENPNYVYTLICRTKVDLVLVKSDSLTKDKFEKFIGFMIDVRNKIAS